MAPEQVQGKRGDARTDIYSLGAMLYEMLTGHTPFDGDNSLAAMNARVLGDPEPLRKLNPSLSPHAEEIVLHAMEREPSQRFPSVTALQTELDNLDLVRVTGRGNRVQQVAPWRRKWRQHRALILTFAVPIVVPLVVALWFLLHHDSSR